MYIIYTHIYTHTLSLSLSRSLSLPLDNNQHHCEACLRYMRFCLLVGIWAHNIGNLEASIGGTIEGLLWGPNPSPPTKHELACSPVKSLELCILAPLGSWLKFSELSTPAPAKHRMVSGTAETQQQALL